MHRFHSKSIIVRFYIAAVLFVLRCVLLVFGVPLVLWAMLMDLRELFIVSVVMLGLFPAVAVAQWMVAVKVRCPLCFAQPLIHRGCAKSRKARRFFMSYRLQVAIQSLFLGHFRCPYCGEPTQMKARQRGTTCVE